METVSIGGRQKPCKPFFRLRLLRGWRGRLLTSYEKTTLGNTRFSLASPAAGPAPVRIRYTAAHVNSKRRGKIFAVPQAQPTIRAQEAAGRSPLAEREAYIQSHSRRTAGAGKISCPGRRIT